jgi:hypothetical protein
MASPQRVPSVPSRGDTSLAAIASAESALPGCRFCAAPLRRTFVDLGVSPLCESYVPAQRLSSMEPFNLEQEIVGQLTHAREWGARFVIPIPQVEVL